MYVYVRCLQRVMQTVLMAARTMVQETVTALAT